MKHATCAIPKHLILRAAKRQPLSESDLSVPAHMEVEDAHPCSLPQTES